MINECFGLKRQNGRTAIVRKPSIKFFFFLKAEDSHINSRTWHLFISFVKSGNQFNQWEDVKISERNKYLLSLITNSRPLFWRNRIQTIDTQTVSCLPLATSPGKVTSLQAVFFSSIFVFCSIAHISHDFACLQSEFPRWPLCPIIHCVSILKPYWRMVCRVPPTVIQEENVTFFFTKLAKISVSCWFETFKLAPDQNY